MIAKLLLNEQILFCCTATDMSYSIYITVCQRSQKYMQLRKPQTSANDDWQSQNQCKSIQTQFESIMEGKIQAAVLQNQLWPKTVIRVIHIRQALKNIKQQLLDLQCLPLRNTKRFCYMLQNTTYLTHRQTQIVSRMDLFDIV